MATRTEQLVKVWAHSRGRGTCRSCGATLTWAETLTGKRMPFDGDPVARHTSHDPATRDLVEHLSADDVHWRTCDDPERFRRRARA